MGMGLGLLHTRRGSSPNWTHPHPQQGQGVPPLFPSHPSLPASPLSLLFLGCLLLPSKSSNFTLPILLLPLPR